ALSERKHVERARLLPAPERRTEHHVRQLALPESRALTGLERHDARGIRHVTKVADARSSAAPGTATFATARGGAVRSRIARRGMWLLAERSDCGRLPRGRWRRWRFRERRSCGRRRPS